MDEKDQDRHDSDQGLGNVVAVFKAGQQRSREVEDEASGRGHLIKELLCHTVSLDDPTARQESWTCGDDFCPVDNPVVDGNPKGYAAM